MTDDEVKVIELCKKELKSPNLSYFERKNLLSYLKRQIGKQQCLDILREVFDVDAADYDL